MSSRIQKGFDLIDSGTAEFAEAQSRIASNRDESESLARQALATFRSAMNWLEDTDHFVLAHEKLDEAGAFVRRTYGCRVHQEGTSYQQRCPVALAHNRIGFSPALVVREAACSICGEDPEDCPHVIGRLYNGERCYRILKKVDIIEVSLVSRPAAPDARVRAISVSTEELRVALPPEWAPGMPVNCDRCLSPCDGVHEPDLLGGH